MIPMTPQFQYITLVTYLRMKTEQRDWHGVADAAMDLRELEARYPELKSSTEIKL